MRTRNPSPTRRNTHINGPRWAVSLANAAAWRRCRNLSGVRSQLDVAARAGASDRAACSRWLPLETIRFGRAPPPPKNVVKSEVSGPRTFLHFFPLRCEASSGRQDCRRRTIRAALRSACAEARQFAPSRRISSLRRNRRGPQGLVIPLKRASAACRPFTPGMLRAIFRKACLISFSLYLL